MRVLGPQDVGVRPRPALHRGPDQTSPVDAGRSAANIDIGDDGGRGSGATATAVTLEGPNGGRGGEEREEVRRPHQRGTHEGHGGPGDRHQYDQRGETHFLY